MTAIIILISLYGLLEIINGVLASMVRVRFTRLLDDPHTDIFARYKLLEYYARYHMRR